MIRALARIVLSTFILSGAAAAAAAADSGRDPMEHFFHPFLGDLKGELVEARASARKGIVVMYHFEDCPSCQKMKARVLNQPGVQDWFRREFVLIPIDTRGAQTITALDGRILAEREFARSVGVRGTPTFDFLGTDGKRLYRHVGGIFDPAEFLLLGRYVALGAFRSQSFAAYKQKGR